MLKSLLSLLLSLFYSKSESAEVASQSLPNETDFTSVTLNTSQPDTFVAPYDGYFCIVVDTGGSINVWGDGLQSSNYSLNNGQSKLFVPMRKGNIIGYSISGRLLFGKFYRLVGGGYQALNKLILQEGGLCLKVWYSSLRRSSLLARRVKSLRLLPHRLMGVLKSPQVGMGQTNGQTLLQLLLTAGLELREFAQAPFIWMLVPIRINCDRVLLETMALSRVYAVCQKARKSTTYLQRAEQSQREKFCSYQATALNVVKGGASC